MVFHGRIKVTITISFLLWLKNYSSQSLFLKYFVINIDTSVLQRIGIFFSYRTLGNLNHIIYILYYIFQCLSGCQRNNILSSFPKSRLSVRNLNKNLSPHVKTQKKNATLDGLHNQQVLQTSCLSSFTSLQSKHFRHKISMYVLVTCRESYV